MILSRLARLAFVAGLLILLGHQRLVGADSDRQLPVVSPEEVGYSVTHLTVEDGLPGRIITSLAQTPDGYLWCGSPSGLARYDGAKFTVFYPERAPALKGIEALELRCDADGRLWIAGTKGQLVVYEHGQFRRLDQTDGISAGDGYNLRGICEGELWIKNRSGDHFYRYHGGRFEAVNSYYVPGSTLLSFQVDPSGVQWGVQTQPRELVHFAGARREVEPLIAPDGKSQVWVGHLFTLQDGTLAVTSSHGIYVLRGAQWTLRRGFDVALGDRGILDGLEDSLGNIWVSVFAKGLVVSTPEGRTAVVSLPDANDRVHIRALLLDREGNIWAAGDDGLYQLRRNAFRSEPQGLAQTRNKPAKTFFQDSSGRTWIFYLDGWARRTEAGWTYTPHDHPRSYLWTAALSSDGTVLLGFNTGPQWGTPFIEKLFQSGRRQRLGALAGNPRIIFQSRDGNLWVGTDQGLWRWEGRQFARIQLPNASGAYPVHALAEDPEGRVFAGAYRHGLYRRDGTNRWRQLTTAADAGSEGIWATHFDDQGTLWVATDSGLARWRNGQWFSYAPSRTALPRLTRSVICDRQGAVWIAGQLGVVRVERRKLNALAAGQHVTLESDWFDRSDGLPSIYCAEEQDALRQLSDGRIWVATAKGAAALNPVEWEKRRERLHAPFVHIEAVLTDNKSMFDPGTRSGNAETAHIVVPPGTRRLEFRYTAINLTANRKCRFRYRLEGVDAQWQDGGDQRAAVYHGLRPGSYRFQVTAASKDGLWNNRGATVAFTVQAFWWQTLWARLGLGALLFGLAWSGAAIRLRQVRRRRAHSEEFARQLIQIQEAERKRLAGELHDDLGQDLLVIKSRLDTSRVDAGNGEQRGLIAELSGSVTNLIRKVRETSHALRPLQLERLGLSSCVRGMVQEVSEASGIHMEQDVDDLRGQLDSTTEIGLYRILQEALNNVVKHSDASEVRVALKRGSHHVILSVRDDGRGFSLKRQEEAGGAPGHGLAGMAERCRLMGGHFQVFASPGQGATIRVEVPLGKGPVTTASQ